MAAGAIAVSSNKNVMIGFRHFAAMGAVAILAGCMVGPDFERPAPPQADRYTETPLPDTTVSAPGLGGAAQHVEHGADLPSQWWALYRSDALDALVKSAIADNPTLASAEAALRVAQENLTAGRGELLYPAVNGNAAVTREKISGSTLGAPGLGTSLFTLYNANVGVSYALDVFGGARREIEGLASLVDYQQYQLEGAYLALTSNVVTAAVREAALRAQIALHQRDRRRAGASAHRRAAPVPARRRVALRRTRPADAARADEGDVAGVRARSRTYAESARRARRPPAERSGNCRGSSSPR